MDGQTPARPAGRHSPPAPGRDLLPGPDLTRILVLCGNEAPGIIAANVYAEAFSGRQIRFIEERPFSPGRVLRFMRRRLAGKGFLSLCDSCAWYARQGLRAAPRPARRYLPELCTFSFSTDQKVAALIRDFAPECILTAYCGLLSREFLERLACPVINVHPGINPRYRGFGNLWALAENRPDLVGYTVHLVDEGADTGTRLCVARLDLDKTDFERLDEHAYREASTCLADLLLGRRPARIPAEFQDLESRYYGVPTLSAWLRARRCFATSRGNA